MVTIEQLEKRKGLVTPLKIDNEKVINYGLHHINYSNGEITLIRKKGLKLLQEKGDSYIEEIINNSNLIRIVNIKDIVSI